MIMIGPLTGADARAKRHPPTAASVVLSAARKMMKVKRRGRDTLGSAFGVRRSRSGFYGSGFYGSGFYGSGVLGFWGSGVLGFWVLWFWVLVRGEPRT